MLDFSPQIDARTYQLTLVPNRIAAAAEAKTATVLTAIITLLCVHRTSLENETKGSGRAERQLNLKSFIRYFVVIQIEKVGEKNISFFFMYKTLKNL